MYVIRPFLELCVMYLFRLPIFMVFHCMHIVLEPVVEPFSCCMLQPVGHRHRHPRLSFKGFSITDSFIPVNLHEQHLNLHLCLAATIVNV